MKRVYLAAIVATIALTPPLAAQKEARLPAGEMKQQHLQMRRQMDSLDARLDSLVTRMNDARGNQKTDAMAAVINELVAQRRMMREHMHEMMQHRRMHRRRHHTHHMKDTSAAAQSAPDDNTEHTEQHPDQ